MEIRLIEGIRFVARKRESAVRCYYLTADDVIHLKSTRKLPNFKTITDVVTQSSDLPLIGDKVMLFVHKDHLPNDLLSTLNEIDSFRQFCRMLVFSPSIMQVTKGSTLPTVPYDTESSYSDYPGFAITRPAKKADNSCPYSYEEKELKDFLGSFYPYAGSMLVLSLSQHKFLPQYKATVRYFMENLMRGNLASSVSSASEPS